MTDNRVMREFSISKLVILAFEWIFYSIQFTGVNNITTLVESRNDAQSNMNSSNDDRNTCNNLHRTAIT